MILLHRITPFGVGLASLASFALLMYSPAFGLKALIPSAVILVALFSRLLLWEVRRPAFWVFLGTPMILWSSAMVFFFFLEDVASEWVIAAFVSIAMAVYAENCFAFYHLPSAYQAYALENLSLVFYVVSAFFLTSGAFGAQLFLLLPVWIPMLIVFLSVLFATTAMFWVSKIGFETGRPYAIVGAVLMGQAYVALSMLPTSFVTNAALFAIALYAYLVFARANVLERITRTMVARSFGYIIVLSLIIIFTARWF